MSTSIEKVVERILNDETYVGWEEWGDDRCVRFGNAVTQIKQHVEKQAEKRNKMFTEKITNIREIYIEILKLKEEKKDIEQELEELEIHTPSDNIRYKFLWERTIYCVNRLETLEHYMAKHLGIKS